MNIAIGKLGRSMYFDKEKWSIYAGDDSPKIIYFQIAKSHPNDKFYIIGMSDFAEYKKKNAQKIFGKEQIPDNIIDIVPDVREMAGPQRWRESSEIFLSTNALFHAEGHDRWRLFDEYFEKTGLKFDLGIFMQGPDGATSVGGMHIISDKTGKENWPMQMMALYAGPIIQNLNKQGYPWYVINEDPRYLPSKHKDIFNQEVCCISQINDDKKYGVTRLESSYTSSRKMHIVKYVYGKTERMFMADLKKVDFSNPDNIVASIPNPTTKKLEQHTFQKRHKFLLALNGGYDRLEFVEKWVLNYAPETKIYGKWSEEEKKNHPGTFIEKGIVEMQDIMWESMFTFVTGIDKHITNFVTQKPWKMIYYGIIPFWDKKAYDTDNLLSEIPDYVKVSSPEEMWEKIDHLFNNRDEYVKLLNEFYALLKPEYFNGELIDSVFNPIIEKYRV